MSFTPHDISFLTHHAADVRELAATLPLTKKSALTDAATMRTTFGDHGRAAMEYATAWHNNHHKFPQNWIYSNEAAQQATPLAVATYRARKIAHAIAAYPALPTLVHDVTCSIGTEGAAITGAQGLTYLGSDIDHTRLLMARANVPDSNFIQADALTPTHTQPAIIIADPARRAGGRRIHKPSDLQPPLPDLIEAWHGSPMAIKCAPGLDFTDWEGLVSVVSVDGGVKEACLYTPELSGTTATREAVIITKDGEDTITNSEPDAITAGEPGRYIIDPDGAVVRAGLVRHYGARENLWMLDERIAYLTGDRIPAGRRGFEIVEQVPLKKLKTALAAMDAGAVEILVRGVDVDPDQLRKKLKLKGAKSFSVVVTRIGSNGVAFICIAR